MLRRIRIKNFESHKDSIIEFNEGFTILKGKSDSGKSSVIRALCVVAYNMWEEESVRVGAKYSEFELETDLGNIYVRRGGGKNEWRIKDYKSKEEKEFSAIGKTVPEEVKKILGMDKIELGEVVDLPNVMFQLDKHYMLSEVNGKKCTPNMIAQMIDNIVGLEGVEDLIKKISLEGRRCKRQINENKKSIDELKLKLHKQEFIDMKRDNLELCKKKYKLYKEKLEKLKLLKDILERYGNLEKSFLDVCDKVSKLNPEICSDKLDELLNCFNSWKVYNELYNKYCQDIYVLSEVDKKLVKLNNLEEIKIKIEDIIDKKEKFNELNNLISRYKLLSNKNVEINSRIDELSKMDILSEKLEELEKIFKEYKGFSDFQISFIKLQSNLGIILKRLKIIFSDYDNEKSKLIELLEKHPNCPICGQLLIKSSNIGDLINA